MKKITFITSLLFLLFASVSFATTLNDTETRNLDNFSEVSVSTGINLVLVPGNSNKAVIEAENIDLDEVITEVKGDNLIIRLKSKNWKWGSWKNKKKIYVTLTYKNIEEISASSGSSVKSDHTLVNNELEFSASSGASINLDIEGDNVEADASSGASLRLSGVCNVLDVDVSSGSSVKAADLEANSVRAEASSGANAKVWANDQLKADVSSGGSVRYKGNPSSVDKSKSSGGSISQM